MQRRGSVLYLVIISLLKTAKQQTNGPASQRRKWSIKYGVLTAGLSRERVRASPIWFDIFRRVSRLFSGLRHKGLFATTDAHFCL